MVAVEFIPRKRIENDSRRAATVESRALRGFKRRSATQGQAVFVPWNEFHGYRQTSLREAV